MADRIDSDLDFFTSATGYGGTLSTVNGSTRQRVRAVGSNVALTILATDQWIQLAASTASTKAVTVTATAAQTGQVVMVSLLARSGGSYTIATTEGTVTLDTAGDFAIIQYDGSAWRRLLVFDASAATDAIADGAITNAKMADDAIDSAEIVDGAVDPVHLAAVSVAPAANAACAILNTTTEVLLTVTDATNTAISTTSSVAGQRILLRAVAVAGGGSYTLAVTGGTLTLNATGEAAFVQRNVANDAWLILVHSAGVGVAPDGSIDSAQIANGSIDPAHFAAAAVVGATLGGGTRANTVDTDVTLAAADALTLVTVSSTAGAGSRAIARGTLPVGAPVTVLMTAFDTNAYTAAVVGGTVTFNAVDELAVLMWDGTGLRHLALVGATFA